MTTGYYLFAPISVERVREFVKGINKTQFGLACVTLTEPKLRAPKSNPFAGRIKKVTLYVGFTFANYANSVNGASAAKSGCTADFKADAPKFAHNVEGLENVLLQSNTDPNTYYLALTGKQGNMTIKSVMLIDGKPATEEQMSELEQWLAPSHHTSAKQLAHGISEEQLIWRLTPKLANVFSLTATPATAKAVYEQIATHGIPATATAK